MEKDISFEEFLRMTNSKPVTYSGRTWLTKEEAEAYGKVELENDMRANGFTVDMDENHVNRK